MDAHLLDAVAAGATRRIVYVADTSCYGADRPASHHRGRTRPALCVGTLPRARARSPRRIRHRRPADRHRVPGWVYGNGSWFRERVIEPVMAGRRVLQFGKTGRWVSPIHVHDCARALVHLAEHGEAGGRYFLVNSDPIRMHEFAGTFARLANRPLRVWRVPAVATRLVVGPSPGRRPPGRRRVLEHPTARNRLPLPVSHARAGTSSKSSEHSMQ